ncbi:MAG: hypothetical protein BWX79_02569 [Alphaproteobacteria bacterium ADurb.Bin100]|nr:MAG: hypothetical protein BWX79_02569 [Alphaproteobacteria bacterium ADurb.Bin100]
MVVDQQRRPLIAQTGAGGQLDADPPIRSNLPARDAQTLAQIAHQGLIAQHAVGDVVAEQDPIGADGSGVEEPVETGDTLHMGQRKA